MGLVPVSALVADLTMLGPWRSDDLAVWAKLVSWHHFHELLELELRAVVSLDITRLFSDSHYECCQELETDERC